MHRVVSRVVAAAAAAALVAGCGSSSSSKGATTGSAKTPTISIGVLTDLTGPASDTEKYTPEGIDAGVALAKAEGYNIKVYTVDGGTNPSTILSGAQKLVDQDHVFAVIGLSSVLFSASNFLASKGIPVIGGDYDSSEWLTTPSMFSVFPYENYTNVPSTIGLLMKQLGGTNLGTIGYSISPASADTAKAYALSAKDAGLKAGYVNANVAFGSTNVEPIALAMKSAGVDSMFPVVDSNTGLLLLQALRQAGVNLKVPMFAEEEGDLLAGGTATEQASKGLDLVMLYEPPQMNTAATKEFAHYLQVGAHVTTPPTLNESMAYLSVDALVQGLKKAGPNATQAQFIKAMEGITDYTGTGLLGSPISFAPTGRGTTAPCSYVVQWTGSTFKLMPGTDPICGKVVPGQKA